MEGAVLDFLAARGASCDAVVALPGDLSTRRYFRVRDRAGATSLVAFYPPDARASAERFVAARELLSAAGVPVPRVFAWDAAIGLMHLEDLGERTVYDLARGGAGTEAVLAHVESALGHAARIAALDPAAVVALGSPPLDRGLLRREIGATFDFVLDARGLAALGGDGERFRAALFELCDRLAADGVSPCHRDFMVRNLMPLPESEVAVIDFQDLRLGPPAYDLASLLNDSVFVPEAAEEAILARQVPGAGEREAYARAVVQRSLKAAGTFARFAAAGRTSHLHLVAPTLARAARHLDRLPETRSPFAAVSAWWRSRLEEEPFC